MKGVAISANVVASGGVGTLEHMAEGLTQGKADAVLAASIFHFGEFTIAETKQYLGGKGSGLAIRHLYCSECWGTQYIIQPIHKPRMVSF